MFILREVKVSLPICILRSKSLDVETKPLFVYSKSLDVETEALNQTFLWE